MPTIQPFVDSRRNACDYPGRLSAVLDIWGRKATISTFLERFVEICRTYFLESLHFQTYNKLVHSDVVLQVLVGAVC